MDTNERINRSSLDTDVDTDLDERAEDEGEVGTEAAGAGAGALVAMRLWRGGGTASWALGVVVAAGMGVGFVLSRTVGLPGFHEGEWEMSGVISVLLETLFVGAAAVATLRPRLVSTMAD